MFGFPRLRALIAEHGEESSLEDSRLEELHTFVGEGWQQEDDITLLTLRCFVSLRGCADRRVANVPKTNEGPIS